MVEVDGDELGLGKRTPSNEIPLTSSFTTNCGSPVDEFSVKSCEDVKPFVMPSL